MSNPLQQTIEALAKEKGIEPDVVISAIEEAVATASRKYYKTNENLKTRFNMETGQVDLFALKTVVQEVTNDATEIAIDTARTMYRELYGDDVANGIVQATKLNPLKVPIVIRLTGTNEEIAMKILTENGFTASSDMDEAVKKAVDLAKRGGKAA